MFESNDTFVEDAVKSKETSEDKIKKAASIVAAVVFLGATVVTAGIVQIASIVLLIVNAVIAFILIGNKNIEYEYDYTNGSLEIAKIINNSK